jgi:hypothetical protein
MMDAQTLEVGSNYQLGWYRSFWDDLKQLGTQLKTIRFEVSEDMEPCRGDDCTHDDCFMWETIEDLVKYRFDQGRPFSAVERMVVSEDDRENRFRLICGGAFMVFASLVNMSDRYSHRTLRSSFVERRMTKRQKFPD